MKLDHIALQVEEPAKVSPNPNCGTGFPVINIEIKIIITIKFNNARPIL